MNFHIIFILLLTLHENLTKDENSDYFVPGILQLNWLCKVFIKTTFSQDFYALKNNSHV